MGKQVERRLGKTLVTNPLLFESEQYWPAAPKLGSASWVDHRPASGDHR